MGKNLEVRELKKGTVKKRNQTSRNKRPSTSKKSSGRGKRSWFKTSARKKSREERKRGSDKKRTETKTLIDGENRERKALNRTHDKRSPMGLRQKRKRKYRTEEGGRGEVGSGDAEWRRRARD